ncbi:DUF2000 family protein [Actinacidiphila glaucinigra]|uniref:DUF2000 family protein n=1 Tax=Actinacidiphila glaucinigra TaxID=235986 RepID=UPI0036AB7DCE
MTIYVPTSTPVGERPYRVRRQLPVEYMAIAFDEELSPEEMLHATALVSLAAGARMPDARGLDLPDVDQSVHTGVLTSRIGLLPTTQLGLVAMRAAAVQAGLGICVCPVYAPTAVSDADLARVVRSAYARDLEYAALAVHGRRKSVEEAASALTSTGRPDAGLADRRRTGRSG